MRLIALLIAAFILPAAARAECLRSAAKVWAHHEGAHATWNYIEGQKCWTVGWGRASRKRSKSYAAKARIGFSSHTSAARNADRLASAEIDHLLSIPGTKAAGIPIPRPRAHHLSLEEALVRHAIWEFREAGR